MLVVCVLWNPQDLEDRPQVLGSVTIQWLDKSWAILKQKTSTSWHHTTGSLTRNFRCNFSNIMPGQHRPTLVNNNFLRSFLSISKTTLPNSKLGFINWKNKCAQSLTWSPHLFSYVTVNAFQTWKQEEATLNNWKGWQVGLLYNSF